MKMKLLLCAFAVLVAMATLPRGTSAARQGFRGPIRLPNLPTSTPSCTSVLAKIYPHLYPHCCRPGQYRYDRTVSSPACPSGRQYVLTRKKCPGQQSESRICEPTIAEKASKLAKELGVGDNAVNVPVINKARRIYKARNATASRGRRAITVPCPSSQADKAVCQDILSSSCSRGKRSAEDVERERTLLADLVQAQQHSYSSAGRERRQVLPPTERNVFFVVDSSGSIGRASFDRVLDALAEFSRLFCGDASVGLVTYSRTIDLEFCPTCLRLQDEVDYRRNVYNLIKSARYHNSLTKTGEVVKCLSDQILPSPDCRILTKPTQVVFFTDGNANGCTKVPDAIAELTTRYPTLETYAIGMGNSISTSGVSALLSNTFDPDNVFNVQNIGELEQLFQAIFDLVADGSLQCSPVTFG